jgi:seryl-tRNA synthetase
MLDLKSVAENRERVTELLASRGQALSSGEGDLWARDAERRALIMKVETLRHQQRVCGEEIARRGKAKEDASALKTEMKGVADEIKALEVLLEQAESALRAVLLTLPNLPDASVPIGKDAAANVEVRRVGQTPRFDFPPKAHWDLGVELGILDFERAAKISGARFCVSWDDGARLERALVHFMLDVHATRGYREVLPPYLVTAETLTGTGQLPKFEGDLFKTRAGDRDLYLIPTAEVPLTNLHRDEILDADQLPIRYAAYSPCFRREAGAAGKDTRGILRVHQFDKVEMVLFEKPGDSEAALEWMTERAEILLQRLGLAYRVLLMATRDMGFTQAKKYDLEVWAPGVERWLEVSSCSNFRDFQARRMAIRYRPEPGAKPELVHTLNGSGLALARVVAAILETYQVADGSIRVPEVLRSYLGRDTIGASA